MGHAPTRALNMALNFGMRLITEEVKKVHTLPESAKQNSELKPAIKKHLPSLLLGPGPRR